MVSYTGFLLSLESQFQLIEFFKCVESDFNLIDWVLKCHHITLNMGPLESSKSHLKNNDYRFKITGFGLSDKACCLQVSIIDNSDNFEFKTCFPHVTIAHAVGCKPFHSNQCKIVDLNNYPELSRIILNAKLAEFDSTSKIV